MHRPTDATERLEAVIRQTHRLYLAALMRVEALEKATGASAGVSESERRAAEIDHELHLRLMRALVEQLGYLPKGLAKHAEIRREMVAAGATQQPRPRPGRSARAAARAEGPVRSA